MPTNQATLLINVKLCKLAAVAVIKQHYQLNQA